MKRSRTLAAAAVAALVAAAGCGSSSEPSYCSKLSDLQSSVKGLPGAVADGGASGLRAQLSTIESDARAVVDAARSDFPAETRAIGTSVAQLQTAANGLPADPSASQLAAVAADAAAVVSAVKGFSSAAGSECG